MANEYDWSSLIAPALGAGASLWGGGNEASTAGNALASQQAGADRASEALQPYIQQGQRAAGLLGSEDISKLPGYQRGLGQGTSAINRQAAARGNFNSGNRYKALEQFGVDYDASKTGERQNQLVPLLQLGSNAANSMGNIQTGMANAQARSQIAQSNSKQSGLTNALDLASKYLTSKNGAGQTNAQGLVSGLGSVGSAIGSGVKSLWDSYNSGGEQPQYADDGALAGSPYTGSGNTLESLLGGGGYSGSGGEDYWSSYNPQQNNTDYSYLDY
jgi:hypothetical protein